MNITILDPGGYTAHYDGNLCHELARRGHAVRLDTSRFLFESVTPLGGYEVRNCFFDTVHRRRLIRSTPLARQAFKIGSYPRDLMRWTRDLIEQPPEVLHVQWSLIPPLDAMALTAIRRRGVRIVFTAHEAPQLNRGPWAYAFGRVCGTADAVIVHADSLRKRLATEFSVAHNRVVVVPLGGPGKYAGTPISKLEARERHGIPPGVPVALFFGLIKPYKGLDLLLEAIAIARRTLPDLQLIVAGQPMEPWGKYASQIERLGISDALNLHLGFVPSEDMKTIFGAADVVVVPYRRGAQSGVVIAAWHFGRPVVATRVGGIPELVQSGINGLLAEPGSAEDLANRLLQAFDDENRLDRMGEAALQLASSAHSWESIAAVHEQIYATASHPTPDSRR